jgi:hypothetical protein
MKDYQVDADLSFFVGKSLEQICFGSYQVQLNFSETVSLNVESRLVLTTAQDDVLELQQPYSDAGGLLALLGTEVLSAWADANGDLSLEFSNKSTLKVLNENAAYESYQIMNGSSSIIV